MVDEWEAAQPGYSRTLVVLRRVRLALDDMFSAAVPAGSTPSDDAHADQVPDSEGMSAWTSMASIICQYSNE
jgi:hypothetical protein